MNNKAKDMQEPEKNMKAKWLNIFNIQGVLIN